MDTLFSAAAVSTVDTAALTRLTVHRQVAQGSTGSPLNFDVGVLEEEKDGFEGVPVHFSYIFIENISRLRRLIPIECPPLSVISAKVKLALRWRSTLSE